MLCRLFTKPQRKIHLCMHFSLSHAESASHSKEYAEGFKPYPHGELLNDSLFM